MLHPSFYLCKMKQAEAIIFDLGGVILNLNYQLTIDAFKDLGMKDFDAVYTQMNQSDLFDKFETGQISSFHFINRLLDQLPKGCNANQVVHAWNAMILDFPVDRLIWLNELKTKKRLFLLSNTNTLHMDCVRRSLKKSGLNEPLENYFERTYFSHEMHMRKPNTEVFLRVCEENMLVPSETVFIDDTLKHVVGADKAGLQAIHLKPGQTVQSLFS